MDHNWYELRIKRISHNWTRSGIFTSIYLIRICEVVWLTFMLILIDNHIEQKLGTKVSQNMLTHRDVQYDSFSACDWSTSTKLVVSFVYSEVTLLTQLVYIIFESILKCCIYCVRSEVDWKLEGRAVYVSFGFIFSN